jgi:long-chain acyl-CoA synthetase
MNVLYALRRARQFYGDRVAIFDDKRTLNYREFYARVMRASNVLLGLGVKRGDSVAVWMLNSPAYLELYYATAFIGAMIVPINTRWNLTDVAFILSDSESVLLCLDDRFAPHRAELRVPTLFTGSGPCPDGMVDYHRVMAQAATAVPSQPEPNEEDIVGLFYTSGTTGGPKGVMLSHRNVCANALYGILEGGISGEWVWLNAAPMFHLADVAFIYSTVMVGAAHCFLATFEPELLLQAVERYRVTNMILVPTMINAVVNHPAVDRYDKSSLKVLYYGASPMPLELLRRAREKLGCEFCQGYGLTETSPILTLLHPEDHQFDKVDQEFAPVKSAGRAVLGVEIKIVDVMDNELPPGEVGEVVARGAVIMKGYWKRPEITAEVMRGGWFHTGDMGVMDERGYLYIRDRKKDMIKPGGENVYSPEVESMICSHPDVLEVAVIGVADEKWGESIKAVVVVRPGQSLKEQQLIDFCRERMTHFKCPTSVEFVEVLPKGGSGKILKNVLRQQYGKKWSTSAD